MRFYTINELPISIVAISERIYKPSNITMMGLNPYVARVLGDY